MIKLWLLLRTCIKPNISNNVHTQRKLWFYSKQWHISFTSPSLPGESENDTFSQQLTWSHATSEGHQTIPAFQNTYKLSMSGFRMQSVKTTRMSDCIQLHFFSLQTSILTLLTHNPLQKIHHDKIKDDILMKKEKVRNLWPSWSLFFSLCWLRDFLYRNYIPCFMQIYWEFVTFRFYDFHFSTENVLAWGLKSAAWTGNVFLF